MKIYGFPLSNPSRFCFAVAEYLNVPYEPEVVDLIQEEQKSEEHKKRHPMGKVPVLEDADFKLFESVAIARYICDNKAPGNTLYPTDLKVRAKVDEALGAINDYRNV